jgi:hypothetical protein
MLESMGAFRGMYDVGTSMRAEISAHHSENAVSSLSREMALAMERLDKLILLNMAMWSLIQEKTSLTEEDLLNRAQEIDLRDGVPDGKVTRTVKECANCGRMISKRHNKCMFCGCDVLKDTVFEGI